MIYMIDSYIFSSFIIQKKNSAGGMHASGPRSREKFSSNNSTGCDAG